MSTADEKMTFHFTGTVTRVEYLGASKVTALLTHFDPRFVAYVQIERADEGLPFAAGIEEAFAIHSKVHTFMVDDHVGARFEFELTRRVRDGRTFWSFDTYARRL